MRFQEIGGREKGTTVMVKNTNKQNQIKKEKLEKTNKFTLNRKNGKNKQIYIKLIYNKTREFNKTDKMHMCQN